MLEEEAYVHQVMEFEGILEWREHSIKKMEAINELGADVEVRHITDEKIIRSYGVHKTPAVMTVSYKMKSQDRLPSVAVVREWIKEVM